MVERKSVSKKIRFEVFKRDSFQCQYCGESAPKVTLELDHIEPVSKGGSNDITNLVTSCFDCNRGKSDRQLNDDSVISKQHEQLAELNERKQQLEMMMEWRKELMNLQYDTVRSIADHFESVTGASINDTGMNDVKKWVKKYEFPTLLEAIERAASQYDDLEKAFTMVPRIAYYIEHPLKDWEQDLFYIRGIARNKCSNYFDNAKAIILLKEAYKLGVSIDELKDVAYNTRNWTDFRNEIEDYIEVMSDRDG